MLPVALFETEHQKGILVALKEERTDARADVHAKGDFTTGWMRLL